MGLEEGQWGPEDPPNAGNAGYLMRLPQKLLSLGKLTADAAQME
jgi:hypothetical protein